MQEDVKQPASETTTTEADQAAEKKPWVTPVATASSVAQVTKTGVAAGKDATCHS